MSLKSFHIIFITIAVLLAAGCAYGAFSIYRDSGGVTSLVCAIGSALSAVLLVVYGVWFLRKTRKLII
jgi:hypothetical protein